jgi:alkylation response protein AidB-like acyl-CoA dehydrogenase
VSADGRVRDTGHSDGLWQVLAAAGWLGIPFADEHGGSGATVFELGIAFREAGRALVPTTFASTIFAALLIERLARADQAGEWLPRIVAGSALGTVAVAEPNVHYREDALTTVAELVSNTWQLNGEKAYVPNARLADVMPVAARISGTNGGGSVAFFLVPPDAPGVQLLDHATFAGHPQSRVRLTGVKLPSESLLGGRDQIAASLNGFQQVRDVATALQCMEMLGGAEKVLDLTCLYVQQREQFGRPIGTFQAVQHVIADLSSRLQGGKVAALRALWLVSRGRQASREVSIAKAWLSRAYVDATVWAHQLYGGVGYVRETALYRWSERARVLDAENGTPEYHLDRVARLILA